MICVVVQYLVAWLDVVKCSLAGGLAAADGDSSLRFGANNAKLFTIAFTSMLDG